MFPLLRYAELNPNRVRMVQPNSHNEEEEEEEERRRPRRQELLYNIEEDQRERSFGDSMRTPPTQPTVSGEGGREGGKEKVGPNYVHYFGDHFSFTSLSVCLSLSPSLHR